MFYVHGTVIYIYEIIDFTDFCQQPSEKFAQVCSPTELDIDETPNRHMLVRWNPCGSGLYDVTGYNVSL